MNITYIPPVLGVAGLIIAFFIYGAVKKWPDGEGKVAEIGEAIEKIIEASSFPSIISIFTEVLL